MKRLLLLALVGAVLLNVIPVLADGDFYVVAVGSRGGVRTKITTLPYTITSPGFYYLGGNLTQAFSPGGDAITVSSDDVTLDLMGFCLSGPGKQSGIYSGIYSASQRSNVEIRNGSVRYFGGAGISFNSGSNVGIRVIGVRVRETGGSGIGLNGNANLVMDCSAMNAGNICIDVTAAGNTIKGNLVSGSDHEGIRAGVGSTVMGNVARSNGYAGISAAGSLVIDNVAAFNVGYGIITGSNATVTRNTAGANGDVGIRTDTYCTITNNTTDGLTYDNATCNLANNTVTP
jgi:hypothetical protein